MHGDGSFESGIWGQKLGHKIISMEHRDVSVGMRVWDESVWTIT